MRHHFFLLLLITAAACTKPTLHGDLIISDINIVDVKTGMIEHNMDVVITHDTIQHIVRHGENGLESSNIIDAKDHYLIPGLWDMHTHTWFAHKDHFPLLIANGVTGVRDMFGAPSEVKKIRQQIQEGQIDGPTIVTSGAIIDGKNYVWPGSDAANTPEEGRQYVRKQIKEGADFIKVYSGLKPDVFMAIAAECKKVNFPFCGHIPTQVKLEEAVNAGLLSSEHFFGVLEYTSSQRDTMYAHMRNNENDPMLLKFRERFKFVTATFDKERVKELNMVLRNGNMYLTPTAVVNRAFAFMDDTTFTSDNRRQYLPDYLTSDWNTSRMTAADFETERNWYKLTLSIMKEMVDGGAQFLAGTDYGNPFVFPGFSLHDELEIFVKDAHLTPLQALKTATINPAYYLRRQRTQGSVDEKKVADLLVLSANPLEDITNTRKITGVILRGKYHDGDTLRSQLEAIAEHNKLPKLKDVLIPILEKDGVDAAFSKYDELKKSGLGRYNVNEAQLNVIGYERLRDKQINEALRLFQLNVMIFPEYANGFDSLGDAYVEAKQNDKALASYQKAVALGFEEAKTKVEKIKRGG